MRLTALMAVNISFTSSVMAAGHPVRVWGDLTALYRERDFNAGQNQATDWQAISTINASSFIWKPWFALVDGGLSLTADKEEYSDQSPTKDKYINGNLRLNVFPASRFPFLMYASKSQNELDDEDFGRTITNSVLGMRQQYTSVDGLAYYSGKVERNVRDDVDQESFVNDNLGFTGRYKMQNNIFYGDIDYSETEKPNKDDELNYAITGRHSYSKKSNLSIENLVSTAQSHNDFINNSSDTKNDQMSSFMSWRPGNRQDLSVTGSLRVSDLSQSYKQLTGDENLDSQLDTQNEQVTLNINQSLIYNVNQNVTVSESLNGTQTDVDETQQFTGTESLGINYSSDSLALSYGFYSWNAGANVNNQHGDSMETESALRNELGHSFSKDLQLSPEIRVQSSFNQSAGYEFRDSRDDASDLNHSITMNWAESSFIDSSSVRFMLADTRNNDIEDNVFQLINLQVSYDYRITRHAHFVSNITMQGTRVTTRLESTKTHLADAQINYINRKFADVHGLAFKSELLLNYRKSTDKGDEITKENDDLDHDNAWRNELVYRIGLFESHLNLDFVKKDSEYDRVIKVQLIRRFGDL